MGIWPGRGLRRLWTFQLLGIIELGKIKAKVMAIKSALIIR